MLMGHTVDQFKLQVSLHCVSVYTVGQSTLWDSLHCRSVYTVGLIFSLKASPSRWPRLSQFRKQGKGHLTFTDFTSLNSSSPQPGELPWESELVPLL